MLDPARLGLSVPQALALLTAWRPAAIFTTGGYVAIPVLTAAAALRIPAVLWEGNVIPGRSARLTARMARAISVSFEPTCEALRGECYVTGTPIRELGGIDRAASRTRLDIPADARCVLIFGGSQTVRRFEEAVAGALPRLAERAVVIHVTGAATYGEALQRREALPPEARAAYRPYPFLRDEMVDALASADLVVARAGASTIAEVTAIGIPLVVVPYPHAGGHQVENARLLEAAGAARIIPDASFDGDALLDAVTLLDDPHTLETMRTRSRGFGRGGAADANAELVLALAERRPLPTHEALDAVARAA